MIHNQLHSPVSLFSGAYNMPSPSTQIDANRSSPAKIRVLHGAVPLSVRQIARTDHSGDEKSAITRDGFDFVNVVRLMGLVINKVERVTDISFTLDDGTGRIDIHRRPPVNDFNEIVLHFIECIYVNIEINKVKLTSSAAI